MNEEIEAFLSSLQRERGASGNTVVSYRRDLNRLSAYLQKAGIADWSRVTRTGLNSYLLHLEREGKAAASISRMAASMRTFFRYEVSRGRISGDPAEFLKAPQVKKKESAPLNAGDAKSLLRQPEGAGPKAVRDRAMLQLLYDTGIRVSELVELKKPDVNCSVGYVHCTDPKRERTLPFSAETGKLLSAYLQNARPGLLKGRSSEWFFVNCSGKPMTRQGFWKIVKTYGAQAGIRSELTPHSLACAGKCTDKAQKVL